jgi:hypothetical protein
VIVEMKAIGSVLQRHQKAQRLAIVQGLRSGARLGRTILVARTPKDIGMAKAAWKTFYHGDTGVIATVENSSPYIGVLNAGARPHAVSKEGQEAIFQWVLRNMRLVGTRSTGYAAVHGNDLHEGQGRKKLQSQPGGEALARQIAFLICRKIRLRGQAPTWFARNALPDLNRAARGEVERCMAEIKPGGQS